MGYKVISCRRGRQTIRLLFEGGFYSRAAFIGEFTVCVVMPFHEWAMGSLPPVGHPPTWQEGISGVHVSVWSIPRSMTSQIGIDCEALW